MLPCETESFVMRETSAVMLQTMNVMRGTAVVALGAVSVNVINDTVIVIAVVSSGHVRDCGCHERHCNHEEKDCARHAEGCEFIYMGETLIVT